MCTMLEFALTLFIKDRLILSSTSKSTFIYIEFSNCCEYILSLFCNFRSTFAGFIGVKLKELLMIELKKGGGGGGKIGLLWGFPGGPVSFGRFF